MSIENFKIGEVYYNKRSKKYAMVETIMPHVNKIVFQQVRSNTKRNTRFVLPVMQCGNFIKAENRGKTN